MKAQAIKILALSSLYDRQACWTREGLIKITHEKAKVKCQSQDVQNKWIIRDASPGTVHFSSMTRSKLSQTI